MEEPLTETESRLMYARIFEDTGLVIGWKSIKNYSLFVSSPAVAKPENPSVATLDTLARYVMGAPYTTEPERKKAAGHYPYWYEYKAKRVEQAARVTGEPERKKARVRLWFWKVFWKGFWKGFWWRVVLGCVVAAMVIVGVVIVLMSGGSGGGFAERF